MVALLLSVPLRCLQQPYFQGYYSILSPGDEAAVKEEEDKKEEGGKDEKVELKCCVMLQKELAEGLTDEECGRAVEEGHAGLCE